VQLLLPPHFPQHRRIMLWSHPAQGAARGREGGWMGMLWYDVA
jgi:hypothetical protein